MSSENELLEPLATEAGQQAIAAAIRGFGSLENALRAERAAETAIQKASDASDSATAASGSATLARNWATKMDTYVDTETIVIPAEEEGEEDTTETVELFSARYYALMAQDIYNNLQFDNEPTENSTNIVSSGVIYDALDLKADKSTTYTKTEIDTALATKQDTLTIDNSPTENSTNLVKSGGVYAALEDKADNATTLSGYGITDAYTKSEVDSALGNVQSTLTFDSAPTQNSTNPVTSGGLYTAFQNVQSTLTFDNAPTANSDNPVKSSGIKTALDAKQDTLTFDSTPTQNSTNPVTSGGVYTALQNVEIEIDDEITEDSDNPVTSAAIYEALQNFTPSGGGSGAGNASGVVVETIYTGNNSMLAVNDELNLLKSWKDYDVLEFMFFPNTVTLGDSNPYGIQRFITTKSIQDSYSVNQNFRIGLFANESSGGRLVSLRVPSDTKFVVNTIGNQSLNIKYINGIKFSKNLSEQMYSNVLYENSSGTQGNITLNDSYKNYDFIEIFYSPESGWNQFMPSVFKNTKEMDGGFLLITEWDETSSHHDFIRYTCSSNIQLNMADKIGDTAVYKIIGYKMAKGGYSGIVSDARMTVKSGTVTLNETVNKGDSTTINVSFDSPMQDTNYEVFLTLASSVIGDASAHPRVLNSNKTVNGFQIDVYVDQTDSNLASGLTYDWIAIRPNSYTREGMVEDVLFSNASGVDSGTINLSGNISDYDFISFDVMGEGTAARNTQIYLSSYISASNQKSIVIRYHESYVNWHYGTDNSIVVEDANYAKIAKITGIKFGRYVSGIAVDTEVTEDSPNVITSGAVYDALQNIPSGGGGGSITIDSAPTENSQNAVSSGGVYDALQDIDSNSPVYTLTTLNIQAAIDADSSFIRDTSGTPLLCGTFGNYKYRINKVNNIPAIFCVFKTREYNSSYDVTFLCGISLEEDGVLANKYGSDSNWGTGSSTTVNNWSTFSSGQRFSQKIGSYYYRIYRAGVHPSNSMPSGYSALPSYTDKTYSDVDEMLGILLNDSNPSVLSQDFEEELFSPVNFTLNSGGTISDNKLQSLINSYRPIQINGETYYFIKLDNGTYYYENPNNTITINSSWVITITAKSSSGSSITVDSTITQGGTNPVEGGAIYTALGDKADQSTTYTKTEVDTALANKGDVTTNTDQNITGTKTFVGSKKVGFKQSTANDKLGFTLYGNTGTERGYLEFNPTNTIDGVAGLMTLGNYASSAAGITHVGFRRYSNVSGANGAYNLLTPLIADAKTPFSLTTTYTNFYLPLGFTDGTTTVKTAKSGVVDLSPLLTAAINSITNANGVSY